MSSPCCIYPQPRPREAWSLDNESWAGLGATSYPHHWSCWSAFGAKLFSIWFRRPKIVQVHSPNSMTSRHSVRTSRNSEFAFNTLYIVTLVVNMSTKTPKATACQSVIPDMSVYKSHENRKERNGQLDRYRIDSSKEKKRRKLQTQRSPRTTLRNRCWISWISATNLPKDTLSSSKQIERRSCLNIILKCFVHMHEMK